MVVCRRRRAGRGWPAICWRPPTGTSAGGEDEAHVREPAVRDDHARVRGGHAGAGEAPRPDGAQDLLPRLHVDHMAAAAAGSSS